MMNYRPILAFAKVVRHFNENLITKTKRFKKFKIKHEAIKNYERMEHNIAKKMIKLINDIYEFGPLEGEGKPEKLNNFDNAYSRRLNKKDRLVYICDDDTLEIISAENHYSEH